MDSKAAWRTKHNRLNLWIEEMVKLCEPKDIYLCSGSEQEYHKICDELVEKGVFVPLRQDKRPGCFWCASDPADVARVEDRTFICSAKQEDAGPTNNWKDPKEMHQLLGKVFKGCMQGRTMYIVPFSMGPYGSKLSVIGVQLTDSPYVVVNMYIMTRMGKRALEVLGSEGEFIPCMHSVGAPLSVGQKDSTWPCAEEKYIVHFPEERSIWSYGSGYGGNALLGKKCLALRIASVKGLDEGWLAEHMLIVGITNPQGKKKYFAAAFPSACGKTNLAMLTPTIPGWKIECVGDDIAWMRFGEDGRLYAINPENGFFGVAPGTSVQSNPNAMETIKKNTIYTNVALTEDKDVWWEGMTPSPPERLLSWKRVAWSKGVKEPAAHPNSRFTAPAKQCPIASASMDDPRGVPIEGIIFGGRRATLAPLVCESFDWEHGVFMGACVSSEMTAAAKGVIGQLRHDPFAMLPFCGYNMGKYFGHWLEMGKKTSAALLPKIFHVNWFRKGEEGKFLWPGYGENSRVLKWMFARIEGKVEATKSAIGLLPKTSDIDVQGLSCSQEQLNALFAIDQGAWMQEVKELKRYFSMFSATMPSPLKKQLEDLEQRVQT